MLPLASSRGPPKMMMMMMGWGPGNQKMMMLGIGGRLWAERGLWRPSTVFRTEVRTAKYLPRGDGSEKCRWTTRLHHMCR